METTEPIGLAALERRLARDLDYLNFPPVNWVQPKNGPDGQTMADVCIVGAGMCGLTAAFALKREGISNIRQIDASPAGREGPWVTYARMRTLRSPKHLTGPAMGMASLTFRAWFEAQWGAEAWEQSGRIPREQWMDYLVWYRKALGIEVENGVALTALTPDDGFWWVETDGAGRFPARKVILANGRDALGGNRIPKVAAGLPASLCSHTRDDIDFAALKGKRVAVLGGGASACDNAAAALEAGAAEVRHFIRRIDWPRINKFKGIVYSGFVHGFPRLTLAERWHILNYAFGFGVAAPRESVQRLAAHDGYHAHLGAPWDSATAADDTVRIETPKGEFTVDHVILATGFEIDVTRPAELANISSEIRTFRDGNIGPDWPDAVGDFLNHPELGGAFEFHERHPGRIPQLANLHCFNQAALLSHGMVAGDIPSVTQGAERLARGIAGQFFMADLPAHVAALEAFDEPELLGDEIASVMRES